MQVAQILKEKGKDVFTAPAGIKVSDAAATLGAKGIGALIVVSDKGRVEGILSERDIVRSLGDRGADCLSENIEAMMTPDPVCASLNDTGEHALARMTEGHFRHMPVIEDGALVGLITLGDVVKARLRELAHENESMQDMIMGR